MFLKVSPRKRVTRKNDWNRHTSQERIQNTESEAKIYGIKAGSPNTGEGGILVGRKGRSPIWTKGGAEVEEAEEIFFDKIVPQIHCESRPTVVTGAHSAAGDREIEIIEIPRGKEGTKTSCSEPARCMPKERGRGS